MQKAIQETRHIITEARQNLYFLLEIGFCLSALIQIRFFCYALFMFETVVLDETGRIHASYSTKPSRAATRAKVNEPFKKELSRTGTKSIDRKSVV